MPSYGAPVPSILRHGDKELREFPVSTRTVLGKKIIFSGGGYFWLVPYPLLKSWSGECEDNGYLLSYIHPRDLDVGQPMLEGLPLKRKFKSYVGTKGAAVKLEKYLKDFDFVDARSAAEAIDWSSVPVVEL